MIEFLENSWNEAEICETCLECLRYIIWRIYLTYSIVLCKV